jgi:hypothetical protein
VGGGSGESRRAADREDNQNLMLRNVRGQLTRSVEALEQARRRAVSFCQGLFFGQGFYFLLSGITFVVRDCFWSGILLFVVTDYCFLGIVFCQGVTCSRNYLCCRGLLVVVVRAYYL